MRLLIFKIGSARLALKVDSIISVGLDKKDEGLKKSGSLKVDLAKILGLARCESPNQAVIKCSHQDKSFEIKADEILGLEDIDPSRHLAWPGVLSFMDNYSGVALAAGQTFLDINLKAILTGLKK
ncbi:hypothetical protein HY768_11445 [candidate division TA06 bacterium]|uniref:CheW-like domain-containing protein n=1 Tax=candidate division TA06 bacterium TaxID=2250710 RepID=A0A933IEA3_UNCT6|nr:hypothetical protein [candidate division TA06 bacterium]